MIQENVNQKFHSMGVLLLLDCPNGLEFGIDNMSWKIGNKFKGIKLIPLGTHIIAYSLQSENHLFKISRFVLLTKEERIKVYRWNERFCQFIEVRGEEADNYRNGVEQYYFDAHLGPYPQENLAFWSQTTKFITKTVLDKLDPLEKMQQFDEQYSKNKHNLEKEVEKLCIDEEQQDESPNQENDKQQEEKEKPNQNPGKFEDLSDSVYYSQIPRSLTGSPQLTTSINMDKTLILRKIIDKQWKNMPESLLGELQYSFIHFIIGQKEESLTQWKKLIDLFVNSESAYLCIQESANLQRLIMEFIVVFYDQLRQFPIDFFRDELSKGNFICHLLKRLKEYSTGAEYSLKIRKRILKLLELIKTRFQYTIDSSEDEEEMPAVVAQQQSYF